MRVVIGEDSALFREGLRGLLTENGHQVVSAVATADELVEAVRADEPDLTIIDVRMPPTMTDDGAREGFGLTSLRDRVAAQGGELTLDSPPGAGTSIRAEIPCAS